MKKFWQPEFQRIMNIRQIITHTPKGSIKLPADESLSSAVFMPIHVLRDRLMMRLVNAPLNAPSGIDFLLIMVLLRRVYCPAAGEPDNIQYIFSIPNGRLLEIVKRVPNRWKPVLAAVPAMNNDIAQQIANRSLLLPHLTVLPLIYGRNC